MGLYWKLDQVHDYRFLGHNFSVGPSYLVDIPSNILNSMVFPDFYALKDIAAYKYILMISIIGSIESVLTVIAVDSITKNKSQLNRDLLGVGIGNLICSLLGGLPMISEVVRSKANIDNGAACRYSNFFHGFFLLLFVSLFVPIIREIPFAALAAMLIITGFRLASPKLFAHVLDVGMDQLLLFMTTLVMTLATDLLIGVLSGCALKVFLHLVRGASLKEMFIANISIQKGDRQVNIKINGPAVFTNFLSFESEVLNHCRNNKPIVVDFSGATLIDHTTLLSITTMANEVGNSRLTFYGLDKFARMSDHKLSTHRYT